MSAFATLPLLPTLAASLTAQGITQPTEIQSQTLGPLLDGKSLIGVSETGSGKTLAYVLPMLHRLKTLELDGSPVSEKRSPRGLVLVPGRELGEQVCRVIKGLTHQTRLRVRSVLGGSAKKVARQNVSGVFEILVATPGRLSQLLKSGELILSDARMVVIDEADQMVDPGFLPVAKNILSACPPRVQRILFSATLSQALEHAAGSLFLTPPVRIWTAGSHRLVATLTTQNTEVLRNGRREALLGVIARDRKASTILFVNTRAQLDRVAKWLESEGLSFSSYRGEMERKARRVSLARFRSGEVSLLLTTDLGGRGLDIEQVVRIINVHLPQNLDNYLHRAGRTARAGRAGLVVNLFTQRDHQLLARIKRQLERQQP